MATTWSGALAPVGVVNDDMRKVRFKSGALSARSDVMPLLFQREESSMGHDGSVIVGAINSFSPSGGMVDGSGPVFDDAPTRRMRDDVAEFVRLSEEGVVGLSVKLQPDMDVTIVEAGSDEPFDFEKWDPDRDGEPDLELLVTRATVMNASAVSGPAFGDTLGAINIHRDTEDDDDMSAEHALVATVTGSTSLPIADRGRSWDGDAASRRMVEAGADTARRGHFYRDPDGDPDTQAAYKLPFADLIDGTLTIVPRGVSAAAGGRGVNRASIPDSEKSKIRGKICRIYGRLQKKFDDWDDCPFDNSDSSMSDVDIESLVASVATEMKPPAVAFADPGLDAPTPITFTDDGRVFGHIATHDTCHVGLMEKFGICKVPPDSATGFAQFNRYPVETDDGAVFAGRLTVGGTHPDLALSMTAAIREHDAKTVAAHVAAGSDDIGIWIAGVLEPDLDPATLSVLERRKVSGDWREDQNGLELVEVLALQPGPREVSEPAFPVEVHMRDGRQTALIACVGPQPQDSSPVPAAPIDYERLAAMTAVEIRKAEQQETRREQLRAELAAVAGG